MLLLYLLYDLLLNLLWREHRILYLLLFNYLPSLFKLLFYFLVLKIVFFVQQLLGPLSELSITHLFGLPFKVFLDLRTEVLNTDSSKVLLLYQQEQVFVLDFRGDGLIIAKLLEFNLYFSVNILEFFFNLFTDF